MTAFVIDYRADRVAVAADTLVYDGDTIIGHTHKVIQLPQLRALLLARGTIEVVKRAAMRLQLDPALFASEDAAEALPQILREVAGALAEENGKPADAYPTEVTFAGWSPAHQRMRLWQFWSGEGYTMHGEFDLAYGGPYALPRVSPAYLPLDRAGASLSERLAGTLKGIAKAVAECPEAGGGIVGGDITLTVLSEGEISHRVIGKVAAKHWQRA